MARDPYVKSGGVIPRRSGGITRDIGGLANAIRRVQAGSTSGLNTPSQGNSGGGGGGAAAPTALDSLPKTPEIQALIDKGILRADMAPEQILAIVGLSSAVAGVPIDIAALKAQLSQDYASTTGNILGMGADWMQQMFGANMPGGNTAAYAADPMFSQYAAGLGEQQATAGLNQATDQAWFDKQQQAMTDYYNGLMQSIAMTPVDSGGGGGGGGGRRHGYGGGGGGGSGGSGDWGFTDPSAKFTQTEKTVDSAKQVESERWPEYQRGLLAAAEAQYGIDSPQYQYILDTIDTSHNPDAGVEQVTHDMNSALATIAASNAVDENNQTWTTAAPANFEDLRNQYERLTGNTLGDNPETDEFEWQTVGDQSGVNLANIAPGSVGEKIVQLMSQAYDPQNPNAMPGGYTAPQENFDPTAGLLNQILNAKNTFQGAMPAARQVLQMIQNSGAQPGTLGGKGSLGSSSPNFTGIDANTLAQTQANPYATGMPGAYSPLSSANAGSISGGPATSVLSPESVMAGTYGPALNQTDQAANVSPYDSSLGDPLRRYYEQMAQQGTTPPAAVPGTATSPGAYLAGMKPHPGQNAIPFDQLIHPPAIQSDPALVDPAYSSAQGGPIADLMAQLGQTGGIPAGAGIDQLPPEIIEAAAQNSNGPPGVAEINHALLQAGLPLLNAQGQLTEAIPGYGPSGNTRPMNLGMPSGKTDPRAPTGDFTKGAASNQQLAASAISRILQTQPLVDPDQAIAQLIAESSNEGPVTGGTVYNQLVANRALTPQSTDQYGRPVPSKLRDDLLSSMQNLSGMQKVEALRGLSDPNLLPQGEGQYYEAPSPELSGDALANAQMVAQIAPGLRDMIRSKSTLFQPNLYSRDVVNSGSSTMTSTINQKSRDPDVIAGVGAGDLNNLATAPDVVSVPYDDYGNPIYEDDTSSLYDDTLAAAQDYGSFGSSRPLVDVNLSGGGGGGPNLKGMAIRRIAQPTPKAPTSVGKSHIKPGSKSTGGKTYSKSLGKKSYVTKTKTLPYKPKNKYSKR